MYGERFMARTDAARARRYEERQERRSGRKGEELELDALTTPFTCTACEQTQSESHRMPGTQTCLNCEMVGQADAQLARGASEATTSTLGFLAAQLVMVGSVVWFWTLLGATRPDQAFSYHWVFGVPAFVAAVMGLGHAWRGRSETVLQSWAARVQVAFYALCVVGWPVSVVAAVAWLR